VLSLDSCVMHLTLGSLATLGAQSGAVLVFAVEWLLACVLAALLYLALIRFAFRRRRGRQPTHQGPLFVALFLTTFAAGNLTVEGRAFIPYEPLFAAPVQVLFLFFFYVFSDDRYAPRWSRWLGIFYTLSVLSGFVPPKPSQSPSAQQLAHVPGLLGAYSVLVGAFSVLGDVVAVTTVVLGILPQIYYRYAQLVASGERRPTPGRTWRARGAALALGGFALLATSGLFVLPSLRTTTSALLYAQLAFYLLVTLLPASVGLALLRTRPFDREAVRYRALVHVPLVACLLVGYALSLTVLRLFFPGFSALPIPGYIPFLIIIALLMAAAFRPLHAQIQAFIAQHFYPRRFEGARILAESGETLRDEVDLDEMSKQLITVLQKATQASTALLWLPGASSRTTQFSPDLSALVRGAAGSAGPAFSETPARPHSGELRLYRQAGTAAVQAAPFMLALGPDDPARASFLRPASVVEIARLAPNSPTGQSLTAAGAQIALPLVSQGELVGLCALGARHDSPGYSTDECDLLTAFTDAAAPRLRVMQLAHDHDVEARERERVEQEMQTARRIQESLLPKTVPALAGWRLATCYQPAREVGGDFYDFLSLTGGRIGIVLGDVTDKGIPAALVMATTRSMLRAIAPQRPASPGEALAQVNELLVADLPSSMFVTCFYAILEPASGRLRYANAGQDLPYLRHADGQVDELRAAGMPLGLMTGMRYDERETTLLPGDSLLFYSDGLVEAHDPEREMFGFPRLMTLLGAHADGTPPIMFLLRKLADFTGAGWEQEDDITLVTLQRLQPDEGEGTPIHGNFPAPPAGALSGDAADDKAEWRSLDQWTMPSEPGNERRAIQRLAEAVRGLNLSTQRLERLQTALGEATLNAMEHGNQQRPELPVSILVLASPSAVAVRITDQGGYIPLPSAPTPDLDAKVAGDESPRGWGLFLMENLVDEVHVMGDESHRTVELIVVL